MVGKQIGNWRVVNIAYKRLSITYYECLCSCGTTKIVRADGLRNGRSTRCRDCRDKALHYDPVDFLGKKFGKWSVLEVTKTDKQQLTLKCKCECGKILDIGASRLSLRTKSCKLCYVKIHGMEATPTYYTWRTMVARCTDPKNHNYQRYAGRGIKVCERWLTFKNFFEDMGVKPDGYQIDRIDNNGNYEPGNCRWVTPKENCSNRRKRPVLWNKKG